MPRPLRILVLLVVSAVLSACFEVDEPEPKTQEEPVRNTQREMQDAIYYGRVETVDRLLKNNDGDFCKDTCAKEIIYAIKVSDDRPDRMKPVVSRLLQHDSRMKKISYNTGWGERSGTPFIIALREDKYPIAMLLLDKATFPEPIDPSAASEVVEEDLFSDESIELIEAMQEKGFDIQDFNGRIGMAVLYGRSALVEYLFRHGAELQDEDIIDTYATAESHNPQVLQLLIEHGANIHWRNNSGLNALEARLARTPPPSLELVQQLKGVGLTINQAKVNKRMAEYNVDKEEYCLELNNRWYTGVSKSFRGAELHSSEDVSIPRYCLQYLN